ncbi:MAG TPA: transcription termination factor NusA [Patescibacteria group bacterium]
MAQQTARTEFAQALKAVATERGLDAEVIIDTIKQAIIAAYKRDARDAGVETEEMDYDVDLHSVTGETKVYGFPIGKPEEKKDVTPPGFGRIAAQTAKQVIHQKIREAEKGAIMSEFSGRVGTLISGMVLRFDGPNVKVDVGRAEAIMPTEERVPTERLSLNQRLTFYLKGIEEGPRGKRIILSRADPEFVKKLFAREVPEIASGSVEIREIAREAGVRTKIAVFSNQPGVDPVGSCVGQKGVRVQAVTNELNGERVDIIPWNSDAKEYVKAALAPVEILTIKLDKKAKIAKIKVPEDQLSLAIGREGQNVRLAGQLTNWKIDIEGDVVKSKDKEEKKEEEKVEEKEEKVESKVEEVEKKEAVVEDSKKDQKTRTEEVKPESEK